jgi:hypothetical protein
MLIWLISPAATMVLWASSLRRTPWALLWFVISVVVAVLFGVIGVSLAHDPSAHITAAGRAGLEVAFCAPALVAVLFTEISGSEDYGARRIQKWRESHSDRPGWSLRPPATEKWEISFQHDRSSANVRVLVVRGEKSRLVGVADPLAQLDEFMNLKAEAESAATQLNALHVE